jgi:CPA1 family monovalent cation:H+ antiporter
MATAIVVAFLAIIALVALANRIGVAYPIVLVLGGMVLGFVPHVPVVPLNPDLVLVIFLPPLLYWESVTAPTSEFKAGAWWIFQLAFGLVIVTTFAVAAVSHAIVPGMSWGVAFVLGAIVSSTDEVAFSAIADKLNVPRHVIGTIEGESLVNDATSLILYAVGIGAVVGASFSFGHAAVSLVLVILESVALGLASGGLAVLAFRYVKDPTLQGAISVTVPFLAYLPAYYLGASGVLATVVSGIFVSRYTPTVLLPQAREVITGFWVTVVFLLNAFIFVIVGMDFHQILDDLHEKFSPLQLAWYALAVAATCVVVRLAWTFAQGLLPITNEPEHTDGKPDWSHVAILGWTGMRGGVSVAAALAIPLETVNGAFPHRDLLIFITFVVLLVTLVGQGGSLPYVIKWLRVKDDGADDKEERIALAKTAHAALERIEALGKSGTVDPALLDVLRGRFAARWEQFGGDGDHRKAARLTAEYRKTQCDLLEIQRKELVRLREEGAIDNTVLRRIQRVLDLQTTEVEILGASGGADLQDEEE